MSGRKRGHYFKYLRCDKNQPKAKIPRQTAWNQKNKVFEIIFSHIISVNRVLIQSKLMNSAATDFL